VTAAHHDRSQADRQDVLVTAFAFFLIGWLMALIMRSRAGVPRELQFVSERAVFNQLFTMHGTIMLLMFATPLFFGFANVMLPLQIGAPDVAFPRLNMLVLALPVRRPDRRVRLPDPGRCRQTSAGLPTPRCPTRCTSPGVGGDLWIMGLWMGGLGTILGAVNFITTIICMRAPGMTMFRMPIFTWNTW
jgi:cytochrome c oxidase subunit 1